MPHQTNATAISIARTDKFLQPVLEQWLKVMQRYSDTAEDNAWWYNERASVGTLAAAVWQLDDWVALEEYSTAKHALPTPANGHDLTPNKQGRCDLWITTEHESIAIEAKQAYQDVECSQRIVEEAMQAARNDVFRLNDHEADHFYAATFIVLTVARERVDGHQNPDAAILEQAENWLAEPNAYQKGIHAQDISYAYYLRKTSRDNLLGKNQTHYFPGVVLVLEHCPR